MRYAILALVLSVPVACSPVDAPVRCTPNGQNACVCSGGRPGTQTCEAGGASYTPCVCPGDMADVPQGDAVEVGTDAGASEDRAALADVVDAAPAIDAFDASQGGDVADAGVGDAPVVDRAPAEDVRDAGQCPGADVQSDPLNCGSCGNACPVFPNAVSHCRLGGCSAICLGTFEGCDSNLANGCETNLATDRRNCGRCRHECAPSQMCRDGVCR